MKSLLSSIGSASGMNHLVLSLLFLLGSPLLSGQNNFFNSDTNPVGIVNDADGNVLMFHNILSGINISTYLSKYNTSGGLIDRIQIGATNEIGALGHIARIPGTNQFYAVSGNGNVYFINGAPLSASLRFNIRNLSVDVSNIYDVFACNEPGFPGTVGTLGGVIIPAFSTYGDIAIWPSGSTTQLFITGLNQSGVNPFIIRITLDASGSVTQAKVLMGSSAEGAANDSGMGVERGIAINAFGVVCSSITRAYLNGGIYTGPIEDLIAFSVDFDPVAGTIPATGPFYFAYAVYNKGMDSDLFGNFYVVTDPVGATGLGVNGEAAVAVIDKGLGGVYYAGTTNNSLSSCRDICYSPSNHRAYFTSYLPPTDEIDGTYWIDLSSLVPLTTGCHNFLDLYIGSPIGINGQFYANRTLAASSTIGGGAAVLFQAGNNIRLDPGFRVQAGAIFRGLIQSCFSSPSALTTAPVTDTPSRLEYGLQPATSSENRMEISIFPNPAAESVQIRQMGGQEIHRIEVYHSNGQLAKTWEGLSGDAITLPLDELPNAVYYLKIYTSTAQLTRLLYKQE